tara:strand:+ start:40 stop:582 length:543 start_codon:yes stop_codon:yes gene_type:complete
MNFIDIIFFVCIVIAVFRGFKKGLIIEFFTFLSLFLGVYTAFYFSDSLIEILIERLDISFDYMPILCFIIIFLITGSAVYFSGLVFQKFISLVQLGLLNKILGIFFSTFKIVLLFGSLIYFIELYDQKGKYITNSIKSNSLVYLPIKRIMYVLIPSFEDSYLFFQEELVNINKDNLSRIS